MIVRIFIPIIFSFFSVLVYSQIPETGFANVVDSDVKTFNNIQFNQVADSILSAKDNMLVLGLKSQYRDFIDSAEVKIDNYPCEYSANGLYLIGLPANNTGRNIKVRINHPDYYPLDTLLSQTAIKNSRVILELKPKYKITLRGRVYTANTPLENVNVDILYSSDTIKLKTLDCFYDAEDFWNCLYHGMFKQDIVLENTKDSIKIVLHKPGYTTQYYYIKLNEYNGQVINFRLNFDSYLPRVYRHNLSLKLTIPIISESNWFAGFSYLYTLKLNKFNRLALGAEGAIFVKDYKYSYETFTGAENAEADTSYLLGFAGPTAVFWITNPQLRKFSLYAGASYSYFFNNSSMNFQPFVGGRMFIDLNKAISFDIRYMNFDYDVLNYNFNPYGKLESYIKTESYEKILISIGLHIGF